MLGQGRIASRLPLAGAILLVLAAVFLYHDFLELSHLGHDSYPIIIASRIESYADLAGTFTEELMDGRYPPGHFYRPVLNLSFALDYAVWGVRPFGYHLTDLVILCLITALMAQMLRRIGGNAFAAAGIAAALYFLVHPVQMNVLPVPPRRGDTLSLLFMLLALHSATTRGLLARFAPPIFTLLASAAKETGVITPVLLFALAALFLRNEEPGRLRRALFASLPSFLILIPFVFVRQAVIGGLGGHMDLTLTSLFRNTLFILPEFQRGTFYPYNFLAGLLSGPVARRSIILILFAASAFLVRPGRARKLGLFLLFWMLCGWLIHGFSGSLSPWYVLHTTAPLSLAAGLVLHESYCAFRRREPFPRRIAAFICSALILTLFVVNLRGAPPFRFHPEWRDLSLLTSLFLENGEREIEAAADGATVELADMPYGAKYRRGSPIIIAAALNDYTVQAWAELLYPERKIRVAYANASPPPPAPDELLVVVRARRERAR